MKNKTCKVLFSLSLMLLCFASMQILSVPSFDQTLDDKQIGQIQEKLCFLENADGAYPDAIYLYEGKYERFEKQTEDGLIKIQGIWYDGKQGYALCPVSVFCGEVYDEKDIQILRVSETINVFGNGLKEDDIVSKNYSVNSMKNQINLIKIIDCPQNTGEIIIEEQEPIIIKNRIGNSVYKIEYAVSIDYEKEGRFYTTPVAYETIVGNFFIRKLLTRFQPIKA